MGNHPTDAEQIRRGTKSENLRRDYELADLRQVLGSHAGQRVIWRMLERCRVLHSVFPVTNPTDALQMAYNSGQQDLGHWLLSEAEAAVPDVLIAMRAAYAAHEKQFETRKAAKTEPVEPAETDD